MATKPRPRLVVGAIILDSEGRVLAARRTSPPQLAGLWEFPGGKVEPGESPHDALIREIKEELGVSISLDGELEHPSRVWPINERFCLRLFFARIESGVLEPIEHDAIEWVGAAELASVSWLPSDAQAIAALQRRLTET